MDDAEIVRRLQGVGDLPSDARRFGERNRSLDDPISEGRTLDELEDEGTDAVRLLEPVDDGNVWMIERCQDDGFPLQTGDSIGIEGECRRQHLDRNVALESGVSSAIDLAHAAGAYPRRDSIGTELPSDEWIRWLGHQSLERRPVYGIMAGVQRTGVITTRNVG